jgi:hypothetical protein
MIIRHSLKLLEKLSQIEDLVRKLEEVCHKEELEIDNEALLRGLLASWKKTSQLENDN